MKNKPGVVAAVDAPRTKSVGLLAETAVKTGADTAAGAGAGAGTTAASYDN